MTPQPRPRGRPKKVVEEPATSHEEAVARYLASNCGIPGCGARNHLAEAKEIVRILSGDGHRSTIST